MKKVYIRDMMENQIIESTFLVVEKRVAETRSGTPYLRLKLSDWTGEIEGRIWEQASDLGKKFDKNDYVRSKGRVSRYQESLQIAIHDIEHLPESGVDPSDFLPASGQDIETMWDDLKTTARSVGNRSLRDLLDTFLEDPQFSSRFKLAPAAKKFHHGYLGGLLEHTLTLCRLVMAVTQIYGGLNRDVLLAGAILHDVGKIEELTYERSFDYSDQGRLLGHLVMGVEMLDKKITTIDGFPEELALILKHLILSHHGEYALGSPKRPKTVEAVILHYLDDMDAKYNGIQGFLERSVPSDSKWTEHHRLFDQFFYKPGFPETDA